MTIPDETVQAAASAVEFPIRGMNGLRLALTAALPFLTGGKVKALEWVDHQHGSRCVTDRVYDISIWMEGGKPLYVDSYTTMRRFRLMNEAKAAAQADYEARIRSALEPYANSYPQGANLAAQSKNEDGSYKEPSPRAQALEPDFWSVHSKTGVHIGLWPIKAHAYEALREYEGGTITPLYRATHDQEEGFRQGIEAAAKLAEYFEETIYSEGMTEDVYYGISCTVSQVIREIRSLSSQPVADGWLPVTTGLNAIGYEIGGDYILKLSYDNLSQFEASREAIQSHLPASTGASE